MPLSPTPLIICPPPFHLFVAVMVCCSVQLNEQMELQCSIERSSRLRPLGHISLSLGLFCSLFLVSFLLVYKMDHDAAVFVRRLYVRPCPWPNLFFPRTPAHDPLENKSMFVGRKDEDDAGSHVAKRQSQRRETSWHHVDPRVVWPPSLPLASLSLACCLHWICIGYTHGSGIAASTAWCFIGCFEGIEALVMMEGRGQLAIGIGIGMRRTRQPILMELFHVLGLVAHHMTLCSRSSRQPGQPGQPACCNGDHCPNCNQV